MGFTEGNTLTRWYRGFSIVITGCLSDFFVKMRKSTKLRKISQVIHYTFPVFHGSLECKILLYEPLSIFCNPLEIRGIQYPYNILCNAIRGVVLHYKPGLTFFYNIWYRPYQCREHGSSTGHSFEYDVGEPLSGRGENEKPELIQVAGHIVVRDPTRAVDTVRESLCLKGFRNASLQLPIPPDEHTEILSNAENCWKGLDKILDAFLPTQPPDIADERRAVGKGGCNGEGSEIKGVFMGDGDFVAVRFKVPL